MQQKQVTRLILVLMSLFVCLFTGQTLAGGKGKGKGEDDLIMYGGNIVVRGGKDGGNLVFAPNQPTNEEVEFSPNFFGGFGDMGFGRR